MEVPRIRCVSKFQEHSLQRVQCLGAGDHLPPITMLSNPVRMVGSTGMMEPVIRCRSTKRILQNAPDLSKLEPATALQLRTQDLLCMNGI